MTWRGQREHAGEADGDRVGRDHGPRGTDGRINGRYPLQADRHELVDPPALREGPGERRGDGAEPRLRGAVRRVGIHGEHGDLELELELSPAAENDLRVEDQPVRVRAPIDPLEGVELEEQLAAQEGDGLDALEDLQGFLHPLLSVHRVDHIHELRGQERQVSGPRERHVSDRLARFA